MLSAELVASKCMYSPAARSCHIAKEPCKVLQALKKRGVDFSFAAPQHIACQDAISRIGRAFVTAQVSYLMPALQALPYQTIQSAEVCGV